MDTLFVKVLKDKLRSCSVMENVPMREHTTFKIGGNADIMVCPSDFEEAASIVRLCRKYGVKYFVMGNGSNLLVSDAGFRGVIIKISKQTSKIEIDGSTIIAEAGTLLSSIASAACKAGLSGLEFAAGIPGTLGGAINMNAGAYGGEMKDVVTKVWYIDEEGRRLFLEADGLEFGYRKSFFSGKNCIIERAQLVLSFGDISKIKAKMELLSQKRREKQPLELPSAGSAFKRPEGNFAAALIDQAGLKGYRIGGAQVSEKHAGFIVNTGGATASDVIGLIEHVRKTVFDKFGIHLETEIKII